MFGVLYTDVSEAMINIRDLPAKIAVATTTDWKMFLYPYLVGLYPYATVTGFVTALVTAATTSM